MRELLGAGWAAVFLPGEPARLGRLLLWKPTGAADVDGTAPAGLETEAVELVLPHGGSVRRRRVEGYAVPVAVAVSALAGAEPTHRARWCGLRPRPRLRPLKLMQVKGEGTPVDRPDRWPARAV